MTTVREYCGRSILTIDDRYIREYCGQTKYEIDGFISGMALRALIAVLV